MHSDNVSSLTWSSVSLVSFSFMAFGETQGISPSQYSGFPVSDVAPLIRSTKNRSAQWTAYPSDRSWSREFPAVE